MANLNFFMGEPLQFKEGISIYPAKVSDAINPLFSTYQSILLISQEDIEDLFQEQMSQKDFKILNPYEFLLANSYNNKDYEKTAKEAFEFFIKKPVIFLYDIKKILVGDISSEIKAVKDINDFIFLEEDEFFDFQNLLRESLNIDKIEAPDLTLHPKIRAMKAKQRYRDKVKAQSGKGLKFDATAVAICCMNLGISPLNIGELSYCAVSMLFSMYQEKEKYELDIQSLLAGADSKKVRPTYWIRNLDEKN